MGEHIWRVRGEAARMLECSDGVALPTPTGPPSVLFPNGVSVAIRAKASAIGRHEKQQLDGEEKTPSHVNQPPPSPIALHVVVLLPSASPRDASLASTCTTLSRCGSAAAFLLGRRQNGLLSHSWRRNHQ
ncbi:hypothetical protein MRX96_002189 [Rhipicephalus microplus]